MLSCIIYYTYHGIYQILVVIGNALVIAAVVMRRRLRSATGLLILSLAVADLLVTISG